MRVVQRVDVYRKRRHRAATKRKGLGRRRHRPNNHARVAEALALQDLGSADFRDGLGELLTRICAYPGVRGVLWRVSDASVSLKIIAPPPMTRPMRILGEGWVAGLQAAVPFLVWDFAVVPHVPEEDSVSWEACWRDS